MKDQMIYEEYEYRGFYFQRFNKDMLWYVVHNNAIVNWGHYQNDLKEWVDNVVNKLEKAFKKDNRIYPDQELPYYND